MRRVLRIVICQAAPYGVTPGLTPGPGRRCAAWIAGQARNDTTS
jgi:hypothetical protein